jgi:isopropylmalate/homocitrate/citramalate synthase
MPNSTITLYDTTLRDGAQGEGIHFSLADKLRIAQRLDAFGMTYIEGGWPGSNEKDIDFFREAQKLKFKHAKLAAFGSTRRATSSGKMTTSSPRHLLGTELAASDPQVSRRRNTSCDISL